MDQGAQFWSGIVLVGSALTTLVLAVTGGWRTAVVWGLVVLLLVGVAVVASSLIWAKVQILDPSVEMRTVGSQGAQGFMSAASIPVTGFSPDTYPADWVIYAPVQVRRSAVTNLQAQIVFRDDTGGEIVSFRDVLWAHEQAPANPAQAMKPITVTLQSVQQPYALNLAIKRVGETRCRAMRGRSYDPFHGQLLDSDRVIVQIQLVGTRMRAVTASYLIVCGPTIKPQVSRMPSRR
jgi:hypothetical protein